MRPSTAENARSWLQLLAAVCLVAANMRMTITGVGPLLEQIAEDQGVSPAALGALGAVPLIAWGLVSPLAHSLSSRLGLSRAVSWSLVALAAGTVWRSLPGNALNLWLGTALIGAALAIGNVLIPAVIKQGFGSRIPLVMGIYTSLLGGMGSVAAGIVVPISQLSIGGEQLGWRVALLCTGALIPAALAVWIVVTRPSRGLLIASEKPGRSPRGPNNHTSVGRRIWKDPLAWMISLYMGSQSAVFYMLSTWLAPFEAAHGKPAVLAGVDVMIFQLVGIAGSMLLPLLTRGKLRRWAPLLLPAFGLIAWIGMPLFPSAMPAWLLVGGLAAGASLTMSITLMAIRARDHNTASALSGMTQSVGYLTAALGPIIFGWLHEFSGTWTLPFMLVWGAAITQLITGFAVGRDRYVLNAEPD